MNTSLLLTGDGLPFGRQKLADILDLKSEDAAARINKNFDRAFKSVRDIADKLNAYQIDLSGDDVTGNLGVSHLNSGTNASDQTYWRGDGSWSSIAGDYLPFISTRRITWLQAELGGSTLRVVGAPSPTVAGSATSTSDNTTAFNRYATSAAIGASSGVPPVAGAQFARAEHLPIYYAYIRTGSDLTNMRLWIGLHDTVAVMNSDVISGSGIMFRYSSVAGDTGFVGVVRDGATQQVTAAIGTIAASTVYVLKIQVLSTSEVQFSVNGGTAVSLTTNIPTSTDMYLRASCVATTAAARNFEFSRHFCMAL